MNYILLINKEKGYTSQDVVSKVKKILNIKKAGHTGTLDPMATGVLPILLNNSTKLSKYLIEHDKTYVATIKLGEQTDTGDQEGKIIYNKEVPSEIYIKNDEGMYIEIEDILKSFLGKSKQKPPMHSAIKVNGKKLYEYARENKEVQIDIYKINLKKVEEAQNEITFEVSCSKGTYIRTLCEDISKKLGIVRIYERINKN